MPRPSSFHATPIMKSHSTRLDRFVSAHTDIKRRDVRLALAKKRITVDGEVATEISQRIGQFACVNLDGVTLNNSRPLYLAMNKPKGVVSATKDEKNKTVLDVLTEQIKSGPQSIFLLSEAGKEYLRFDDLEGLHIVGRLDFNSSGLLLLTNDGRWSRRVSLPERCIEKRYRVVVDKPLTQSYIDAFLQGMYFEYENITTRPVKLNILSDYVAEVDLIEGRYHQIKRMFGRFQNTVLELHRQSVGDLVLESALLSGQSRFLTIKEVQSL